MSFLRTILKRSGGGWFFFFILTVGLHLSNLYIKPPRMEGGKDYIVSLPSSLSPEEKRIFQFLQEFQTGLPEAEERELAKIILEESRRCGCDPELVLAIILVESSFYHRAESPKGAKGLMQIKPSVAQALAEEMGIPWEEGNIFDPRMNIRLGLYYLSKLLSKFKDIKIAITAYNYGPTFVEERLKTGRPIPLRYADKVLRKYRFLHKRLSQNEGL